MKKRGPLSWAKNNENGIKRLIIRKSYKSLKLEAQFLLIFLKTRIEKDLTQKELAEKSGTTQSAIARFEAGSYSPTLAFIQKIADALELELEITVK